MKRIVCECGERTAVDRARDRSAHRVDAVQGPQYDGHVRRPVVALPFAVVLAFVPAAAGDSQANRIAATAAPWAVVGTKVGVRGSVTPHPAGLQVSLQQRKGTGWLTVGASPVRADGSFRLVASPDRVGIATYRVVGANFTGESARVPVRVLHWVYVSGVPVFADAPPISGEVTFDPIQSAGVRYRHAVSMDAGCYNQWGGDAWVDYDLERQYELFTATVGIDDSAPAGSTATYNVIGGDGRKLASGSLVSGSSTKIHVSVAGEYRLRLRVNVPDPYNAAGCSTTYTKDVFGDAELLGP